MVPRLTPACTDNRTALQSFCSAYLTLLQQDKDLAVCVLDKPYARFDILQQSAKGRHTMRGI